MTEKMVLSTSLLIAYENSSFEPDQFKKKYKRLMKVVSLPYKTNIKQLNDARKQGLNEEVYKRLIGQLAHAADRDDSLEQLALKTSLKVILTEDKDVQLPYVYYRSGFISNQITVNLSPTDQRDTFVRYLELLCSSAYRITVCDNYLAQGWDSTQSLFRNIFPRHKLEIQFIETPNSLGVIKNSVKITSSFAQSIHPEWTVSESTLYKDSHDRYLLIESSEGKIELMISSGFDHIWKSNPKEITCVIREK